MVTLWDSSFWNQPLCSSLVVQLHLRPKAVLKRRGVLQVGGWGRVRDRTGRVPLDALAALHLWFILSRLHLDGHHIVAWWHIIVSAVRHLLLGYDPVDFCRTERDIDAKTMYDANNPRTGNEYGLCIAIKAYKPYSYYWMSGANAIIALQRTAMLLKHLLFVVPLQMPGAEQRSKRRPKLSIAVTSG